MKLLYLMSKFMVLCSFETIYWKISLWKPSLFSGWIISLRGGGGSTHKMFSLKSPLLVQGNDLCLQEMKYRFMKHNHRECIGIWKWQLYWKRSSSWVTFYYRNLTAQEAWSFVKFIILYFYSLLAPETNRRRSKSFQVWPASRVLLEHYITFYSLRSYWLSWCALISILFQKNQLCFYYKNCYNSALNLRRNPLNLIEIIIES